MDSLHELQNKWDRASRWYDLATAVLEALVFRRLRSRLLKSASGRVLEVAGGTGRNLGHYPCRGRAPCANRESASSFAEGKARESAHDQAYDGHAPSSGRG